MDGTFSDYLNMNYAVSEGITTPEYFLNNMSMVSLMGKEQFNIFMESIRPDAPEHIKGFSDLMKRARAYSKTVIDDEDYIKKIYMWYKENVEPVMTAQVQSEIRNMLLQKSDEAQKRHNKLFEDSLIIGGKVVLANGIDAPACIEEIVSIGDKEIVLTNGYTLKDTDNADGTWSVYKDGVRKYMSAFRYRPDMDLENFILIRRGLFLNNAPIEDKKHDKWLPVLVRDKSFRRVPVDYVFDINTYVDTYMSGITPGSIALYMNRVFGPPNLMGDDYKDMAGRWLITTPVRNLYLIVNLTHTDSNYSDSWFRFYISDDVSVRKMSLDELSVYTVAMRRTLNALLRPTNERDIAFNITGEVSDENRMVKPSWASVIPFSFLTEDKETFSRFRALFTHLQGNTDQEKLKTLCEIMQEQTGG